jgi:nucleoside-diphosphate kinase
MEQTLAIIKPDAIKQEYTGPIISMIEHAGFTIDRMEKGLLKREHAETFYGVHKEKPFFQELIEHITSGPIIVMALRKENAVQDWRALMGVTDPEKAEEGTIRKRYGNSIGSNAVHGSDSAENAKFELELFFGNQAETHEHEHEHEHE